MTRRSHQAFTLAIVAAALAACLGGCFLRPSGPQAAIAADPPFGFPPLDVRFDGGASWSPGGIIGRYVWEFGDGETEVGQTVDHTFWEQGTYEVTLTVTDSAGKTASTTLAIEALNHVPEARFTYWPYMVAKGQPIEFDASDSTDADGEIVSWYWDFGDGTVGEGEFVEHIYYEAGPQGWEPLVTLTVIDNGGGEGVYKQRIQVIGCDSCG